MEKIEIGLDPGKALEGLQAFANSGKELAVTLEKALGRDATDSIRALEQAVEGGAQKISKYMGDLGKKVKEDLKTAFNVTGVLEGAKFVNEMNQGVRSVFEMERVFSRLQVRLGLTNQEFSKLKTNLGAGIARTGQKLEEILPGVDAAATRGGVKDPKQLAAIGEILGQAKATTGEDAGALSETITEIIRAQGQKVTAASFKATMDALQGTRAAGAFGTTNEAGHSIEGMAMDAKKLGIGTRELGGMAAAASGAGSTGVASLQALLHKANDFGGKEQINAAFGTNMFKNGKLDMGAFQNVKKGPGGQYSEKVMGDIAGITGSNGQELLRFIESMKNGVEKFDKVVNGGNETAKQFDIAGDNLATSLDKFRERMKNATREIGEGLSEALHGDVKGGLGKAAKGAWENKGTLATGGAATLAAGLLMGGGLNALLKKVPGGGFLGGAVGAQAAKAAGIQPVYVTNAREIAGGTEGGGSANDWQSWGKGGAGAGGFGGGATAALGLAAAAIGVSIGTYISNKMNEHPDSLPSKAAKAVTRPVADTIAGIFGLYPKIVGAQHLTEDDRFQPGESHGKQTVAHLETLVNLAKQQKAPSLSNPSAPNPNDRGHR